MSAEINGNHAVARFEKARLFLRGGSAYTACGSVVLTPFFVFVTGHAGELGHYEPIVSIAFAREDVQFIVDHSVEACETHDQMDAEAKAQMETIDDEEDRKD